MVIPWRWASAGAIGSIPAGIEGSAPGLFLGVAGSLILSQHLPEALLGHIMLTLHLLLPGCFAIPAQTSPDQVIVALLLLLLMVLSLPKLCLIG